MKQRNVKVGGGDSISIFFSRKGKKMSQLPAAA